MEFQFQLEKGNYFLQLPLQNNAPFISGELFLGEEFLDGFTIELAVDAVDHLTALCFYSEKKQMLKLVLQEPETPDEILNHISIVSDPKKIANFYQEKYRPVYHFTARFGWINDPNGLIYYAGKYHLFYQHNPYGCKWGNMHWGHAVSSDLLHWEEKNIAIFPQKDDWAYSGCAVVDPNNSAGLHKNGLVPLMVYYTSTARGECLRYSFEEGKSFTEYSDNPILKHAGRDPQVFWYAPGEHWVMAVYEEQFSTNPELGLSVKKRGIAIYSSKNLKSWQFCSFIDGYYECPVLFELPVNGDESNRMWVLFGANEIYQVGDFDGCVFTPRQEKRIFSRGQIYASQLFYNLPDEQRRVVRMACATIPFPGMPFNQMMTFPTELNLKKNDAGFHLLARPIREVVRLHGGVQIVNPGVIPGQRSFSMALPGSALHIKLKIQLIDVHRFTLVINGYDIHFDAFRQELAGVFLSDLNDPLEVELLLDRMSIELFSGELCKVIAHNSQSQTPQLSIINHSEAEFGNLAVSKLEIYEMRAIH